MAKGETIDMSKPSISNFLGYGLVYLSSATSPGISMSTLERQLPSVPFVDVISQNAVLEDLASRIEQAFGIAGQSGTGGSSPHSFVKIAVASDVPETYDTPATTQNAAEAVAMIRSSLSLQIKELALISGVSRPTVYSWLRDEEEPQLHNRQRISELLNLAQAWNSMSDVPIGAAVRKQFDQNGESLVDLLSQQERDADTILARMRELAGLKDEKSKGIREIARLRGIDLTKVKESQSEFDVLSRKTVLEE